MTVKRKLEQTFETAQADEGKENEHSEEWLNDFSQQAESVVALKLAARGSQGTGRQIYHSMGDGARNFGGLAEQSSCSQQENWQTI
jgi:hypothetical protein